ncbi:hypothetical protein RO3G_05723 [Lichtheimia corymbifera JMRC:FSU:9682]|uniref:Uncharacterized protein n=1 Tax=Lichtheimia corymbifera JMRC:FSU:9682 TaxID=1263082 RepID=A0A068S182_9FUNG|nr:hypothetical protein RO3G_05723 [Lichtheimia corymbifera JMRC:FSU:9682]
MTNLKKQKFPHNTDPTKQYFSSHPDQWDFPTFRAHFPHTPVKTALNQYQNALRWILQHDIDRRIRSRVNNLKRDWRKPSSDVLEALSTQAPPPSTSVNVEHVIIGDNNNVTGDNNTIVNHYTKREREDAGEQEENDKGSLGLQQVDAEDEEQERDMASLKSPKAASDDEEQEVTDDEEQDDDIEVMTLWDGWLEFLQQGNENSEFGLYSPEASGIILCGEGVQKRDCMSDGFYEGVQDVTRKRAKIEKAHHRIEDVLDGVLDAATLQELDEEIADISAKRAAPELRNKLLFVKKLLSTIADNVYSGVMDPFHSENSWSQGILWPVMMACAQYIRRENKEDVAFFPGEEELFSMTIAGAATSGAPYYADSVLRLTDKNNIEICLLETSKAFQKATKSKISFDHHKGMFALLSMLKRIANAYNLSNYDQLSELELLFLHAHGDEVRVWGLSTPQEGVYIMSKRLKIKMPNKFSNKAEELSSFVQSCWELLALLEDSVDALRRLESDHSKTKRQFRYKEDEYPVERMLSSLVNPRILKIAEKRHAKETADDGPKSSPFAAHSDCSSEYQAY